MKVLLVEDNSSDRWLYAEIVRSRGHEPVHCEDGDAAWSLLQAQTFPLVLLDLGLPGSMDGLELCQRIRTLPEGARPIILVITGRVEPRTLEEVLAAGADDYVQKPVDVALLSIRLAVAERNVERQNERWAVRAETAALTEALREANEKLQALSDASN
jgi:DNA-binding response OmpR family regulator